MKKFSVHTDQETSDDPAVAHIRVEGFLDTHTALEFESKMDELFEKKFGHFDFTYARLEQTVEPDQDRLC